MKRLDTLAIVGVGLIGGSIGKAVRARDLADRVVGIGRRESSLAVAREVGAVTETTTDMVQGVADADLVIICSPVGLIVQHALAAAADCPSGTLITDAGSTKAILIDELDGQLSNDCRYLGGHPLAGSEKTGAAHSDAELFVDRVTILTPTDDSRDEDVQRLDAFWTQLGSRVVKMTAAEHDLALAMTSHLPHAVAATLAASLAEPYRHLTGTGFRDTSRLGAGDPGLWTQIFSQNRANVLESLDRFMEHLMALRGAIEQENPSELNDLLVTAKKNRDALGS